MFDTGPSCDGLLHCSAAASAVTVLFQVCCQSAGAPRGTRNAEPITLDLWNAVLHTLDLSVCSDFNKVAPCACIAGLAGWGNIAGVVQGRHLLLDLVKEE